MDILIYKYADLLQNQGASVALSIEYAADFVSKMSDESIQKELKHVTVH